MQLVNTLDLYTKKIAILRIVRNFEKFSDDIFELKWIYKIGIYI